MLEEYGAPNNQANQTAIEAEWQQTVLQSDIAYDSFWQFGTTLPSGTNDTDQYTVSVFESSKQLAMGILTWMRLLVILWDEPVPGVGYPARCSYGHEGLVTWTH